MLHGYACAFLYVSRCEAILGLKCFDSSELLPARFNGFSFVMIEISGFRNSSISIEHPVRTIDGRRDLVMLAINVDVAFSSKAAIVPISTVQHLAFVRGKELPCPWSTTLEYQRYPIVRLHGLYAKRYCNRYKGDERPLHQINDVHGYFVRRCMYP